jgi:hypothetical protein
LQTVISEQTIPRPSCATVKRKKEIIVENASKPPYGISALM